MGELLSFPQAKRQTFVERHARRMANAESDKAAETILRVELDRQAKVMAKRGFPVDVIESEMESLRAAIRTMAWDFVMFGGGSVR